MGNKNNPLGIGIPFHWMIILAAFWLLIVQRISTTLGFIWPTGSGIRALHRDAACFSPLHRQPPTKIQAEFDQNSTISSVEANATTERHIKFMKMALEQARKAAERKEVPIGAIVVQKYWNEAKEAETYRILSQAGNSMESNQDASAHAEILAMRQAAQKLNNWRLLNTTLYSTVEPCPMCLSAAQAFRVSEIVYGAPDLRLGAIETYMTMLDDYQHPIHLIEHVVPGVLKEESGEMMTSFFRQRRLEGPRTNSHCDKATSQGRLARWKHRMKQLMSFGHR